MVAIIHEGRYTAKRVYQDNGYEYFSNGGVKEDLEEAQQNGEISLEDLCNIIEMLNREKPWIIMKGDKYVRQFNTMDGSTYVFRMKEVFWNVADKLGLFSDDY